MITGSSQGLGYEMAQVLSQQGATVFHINRNDNMMCDLHVDLSQTARIDYACEVLSSVLERHKDKRWVLINNAGALGPVHIYKQTDEFSAESYERLMNLNAVAPLKLSMTVLKKAEQLGIQEVRILSISSGAARHPYAGWSAYCMSKAALDMAMETLSVQAPAFAKIVSLAPGVVDTGMQTLIRQKDSGYFPNSQRFHDLKNQAKLSSPSDTAQQIIRYLNSSDFGHTLKDDIRNHE
ncbi:MAG: SDR family NAD(P)-dependent oxidoreductase [Alcaligenaceae bacterium]|nr:SDR family NAD(P)-dependent oxidoreductase [Alcaligenaceae bacterium]